MPYSNDISKLKPYEVQVLIDFFTYTMDQEQRGRLMRELPEIYNKICDKEIVVVGRVSDREETLEKVGKVVDSAERMKEIRRLLNQRV